MGRLPRHAEFFRVWTPEMAYVLGLWWTDGCMRIKTHGAHEFEIASNDRDHLETIARIIGGNYSLRKVSEDSQCYKITFCSKEMYQDILAHGGTPHKSRTIGFPYVPPDLLPHFVRGIVDEGVDVEAIVERRRDFPHSIVCGYSKRRAGKLGNPRIRRYAERERGRSEQSEHEGHGGPWDPVNHDGPPVTRRVPNESRPTARPATMVIWIAALVIRPIRSGNSSWTGMCTRR